MAILLLVLKGDDLAEEYETLIADNELFVRYWKPAAARLDLHSIPLFETGVEVLHADIPPLVDELLKLYADVESQRPTMDPDEFLYLVSRIDRLIIMLRVCLQEPDKRLYIG